MKTFLGFDGPQAVLNGESGQHISLAIVQIDEWGGVSLVCAFKSEWVSGSIGLISGVDRLADFSKCLQHVASGDAIAASYINEDGNCEIACVMKVNGDVEVNAHLIPEMISESHLRISFVSSIPNMVNFASQIGSLLDQVSRIRNKT